MGEATRRLRYTGMRRNEHRTAREAVSMLVDLALVAAVIVTLGGFLGAAIAMAFGAFGA